MDVFYVSAQSIGSVGKILGAPGVILCGLDTAPISACFLSASREPALCRRRHQLRQYRKTLGGETQVARSPELPQRVQILPA